MFFLAICLQKRVGPMWPTLWELELRNVSIETKQNTSANFFLFGIVASKQGVGNMEAYELKQKAFYLYWIIWDKTKSFYFDKDLHRNIRDETKWICFDIETSKTKQNVYVVDTETSETKRKVSFHFDPRTSISEGFVLSFWDGWHC